MNLTWPLDTFFHLSSDDHILYSAIFKLPYNHFLFYINIQFQIDWDASLEMHQKVVTTQHLVANNYILNILKIKLFG